MASGTRNSHELQAVIPSSQDIRSEEDDASPVNEEDAEIEMRSLPPTDHGKQAYLVLAGCTLIQAPVWGYSLAFGVFQEYYTTHRIVSGSSGSIATVGTTLNGVMYLMMPVTFTLLSRYPRMRRYTGPIGLVLAVGSLVLSSFATHVWQLIASQGVLCAIGSGFLFSPTTLYLDEWFISRKGLAYGVMWAGKSFAGVIFPFIMSALLRKFGPATTLRVWAVCLFILTGPLLYFLKPRIPLSRTVTRRPLSWSFLKHSTFWMLQAGNVVQALGYLIPSTYLASYAHTLGLPETTGALLLALFSLASTPGGIIHGVLGDHISPVAVILVSSLGSALPIFLFWGFSSSSTLALLVLFCLVYGFFAGGFSSTYPGILREIKRVDEGVDTGLVMGLLLGGRGLGFVIGGPVSSSLLRSGWSAVQKHEWGYATGYRDIIIATGVTALLGGWSGIWKGMRKMMA